MSRSSTPSSPMTERIIGKIRSTGYRRFIAWAGDDDGHLEKVHIAGFDHPTKGACEAFVKLYPADGSANRGLANELTAFLYAHALNIPQPELAFIANVPLKRLGRLSGWLATAAKAHETLPGFCTLRLDGASAAVRVPNTEMPSLIEDIQKWPDLPNAVALDENIANTDRHLNNLIRLGRRRFAVIDGGRLANSPDSVHWTAKSLDPTALYRNRLSEHVWHHNPENKAVSLMLDLATKHPVAFDRIADELDYWWRLLLSPADHALFKAFMQTRTHSLDLVIRKRYHRLI